MGRLLEALRAESGTRPAATPATLATPRVESSRVARVAAPPVFQTERLLAALRAQGLPDEWLGLDHGDASGLAALTDKQLSAYVAMLTDADLRELGKRPSDETAAALCRSCGPVWLHPVVAAAAPVAAGCPRVLGCPWCHVKNCRAIPRPPVTCGDCLHFIRDAINPDGGMGRCGTESEPLQSEPLPFPHAARQCDQFKPKGTEWRGNPEDPL